ncbi:MAG: cytochrome c biogenesis protein ResB, partial [Candidatus Omnitrophica bacterium]|nr:cytochrome c biogenesis protein ResB [Candidatus Omnitrophota bacterium]
MGFLAVNLAAAALQRWPWKRRHVPFVLAHIGIILTLMGGILGGRLGVEGQMIIPEGSSSSGLQLPRNVLVVHQPNPGIYREFRTDFESTAWVHEPHALFEVPLNERPLRLVVDRYYPDASIEEEISDEGIRENPAIRLLLSRGQAERSAWLFSRDPNRFAALWGNGHLLFLELTGGQASKLLRRLPPHSVVFLRKPDGTLAALLTGEGSQRRRIDPLEVGRRYPHPWLGVAFEVEASY